MGGPWRDRRYTVPSPPPPRARDGSTMVGGPEPPVPDLFHVYAVCLVLGMILGAVALILVSPWLPFAVLR